MVQLFSMSAVNDLGLTGLQLLAAGRFCPQTYTRKSVVLPLYPDERYLRGLSRGRLINNFTFWREAGGGGGGGDVGLPDAEAEVAAGSGQAVHFILHCLFSVDVRGQLAANKSIR